MSATEIEIAMLLDLGDHAPRNLLGLARALALTLIAEAEEVATTAAEASGSEEIYAARPVVRYRAGGSSEWHSMAEESADV